MKIARILATLSLLAAAAVAQSERAGEESPSPLLDRVATLGASVTGGFGTGLPMARMYDHAIRVKHVPVKEFVSGYMPLDAETYGEMMVDDCIAHRPTLVIALDFLFWYSHGVAPMSADEVKWRTERVAAGLKQLERFGCPILLGHVPAMAHIATPRIKKLLFPSPEAVASIHARVTAWAKKRPHVMLAPVGRWVERLRAGRWKVPASACGRHPDTPLTERDAMLGDRLHPSRLGSVVLAGEVVDLIRARHGEAAADFRFDPWEAVRFLRLKVPGLKKASPKSPASPAGKD
jgi:hypothetical protein